MTYTFREKTIDDVPYIASTWLESFKEDGKWAPLHEFDYYDAYRPTINRLIDRSKVLIATITPETDDIDGWIVYEDDVAVRTWDKFERRIKEVRLSAPVVHYVYVRGRKDCSLRNLGLGTALLSEALARHQGAFYTFKTRNVRFFDDKFFLTYAPWYASKRRPDELPNSKAAN